jgi:hypothetical protein
MQQGFTLYLWGNSSGGGLEVFVFIAMGLLVALIKLAGEK